MARPHPVVRIAAEFSDRTGRSEYHADIIEDIIDDQEILDSIRTHTTGSPDMSLLQKIIFTADYIEPNRCLAPNLSEIRHMAFSSLDTAIIEILKDTLDYLYTKDHPIDPMTRLTYEFYTKGSR